MYFLLLLFLKSFGTNSFGMTQFHAWLLCGFMKARRDLNENWFFVWKFGCNHFPIHFVHKKLVFFLSRQFLFVSGLLLPHLGNAFTLFFLTRCIYLTRIWWKRNAKDIKLVCHYCQPLFSHIICQTFFPGLFESNFWITRST